MEISRKGITLASLLFLPKLQGVSVVDIAAESVKKSLVTCPDVEQQLLEASKKGDLETVKVRVC